MREGDAVSYTHLDVYKRQAWKSGDTDMKCLVASGMAGLMDEIFDDLNEQCRKRLKEITIGTLDHRIFGNQNKER